MRRVMMLGLGFLWVQSAAGCVPPAGVGAAWHASDVRGPRVARHEGRVLLVVTNRSQDAVGVYVLRAGHAPIFVGVADPGRSSAFDATAAAPRGSRVRFAALARRAGDHLITDEVSILRAGTIVIEIESDRPRERRVASTRRTA